jgi:hypothetical protein
VEKGKVLASSKQISWPLSQALTHNVNTDTYVYYTYTTSIPGV